MVLAVFVQGDEPAGVGRLNFIALPKTLFDIVGIDFARQSAARFPRGLARTVVEGEVVTCLHDWKSDWLRPVELVKTLVIAHAKAGVLAQ